MKTFSGRSAKPACNIEVDRGAAATVPLVEALVGTTEEEEEGMPLLEELTVVLLLQVLEVLSRRGRSENEKEEGFWFTALLEES